MTVDPRLLPAMARELRQAFDSTFARPLPAAKPPATTLLLVRAGDELFAVKRSELTGFVRADGITPAPGGSPAFLGLAGARGGLYPVWSLAGLLGRSQAAGTAGGWLLLAEARADAPCAFACDAFLEPIFVPETEFAAAGQRETGAGFVQALVPWNSGLVPVVSLPALQSEIGRRKQSTQLRRSPP